MTVVELCTGSRMVVGVLLGCELDIVIVILGGAIEHFIELGNIAEQRVDIQVVDIVSTNRPVNRGDENGGSFDLIAKGQ